MQATSARLGPLPSSPSPELVAALEHGLALHQLLEQEFDALREQNLDIFEALQPEKSQIFDSLVSLTGVGTESNRLDDPEWDTFKNLITDCRDMHRRNEILITRKLDAIRGTLQTLNGGDTTASVEVYDRLGRMARSRGGRGYEEA
jgi:flagellar biosynthesis/type III secretory pathway chaperone